MSDFQFQLSSAANILFQSGFTREVESVTQIVTPNYGTFTFMPVPSGPMLFKTTGVLPNGLETLYIAESSDPTDIVNWIYGKTNNSTKRSFPLSAGIAFKQYIPINGPYMGLRLNDLGSGTMLSVSADGLIQWAPSTANMAAAIHMIVGLMP